MAVKYGYDMFVGVCRPSQNFDSWYLGISDSSWALSLSSGKIGCENKWKNYA